MPFTCMLGRAELLVEFVSNEFASHARGFILVDALCSTNDNLLWY